MTRELAPIEARVPQQMRQLAEKLRACMVKAQYSSLRELAAAAGLAASTVSDACSGARTPSWDTVKAVLKACDEPTASAWLRLVNDAKDAERRWRQDPTPQPAQPSTPGMHSIRPPIGDLPPHVRGRDDLLRELGVHLTSAQPGVHVLHGLGGCGKTTVAMELARKALKSGMRVFWLSAHQRERVVSGMRAVAAELGIPEDEINEAWSDTGSAPDLLWRHLDVAGRRWLLVVDNADEPDLLAAADGTPGDGTGWVRNSAGGMTVVTSRTGGQQVWGLHAVCHLVDVLADEDAADLLLDFAGRAGDRENALKLAHRLGGLPLALVSAGSYLARSGRGLLRHRSGASNIHIRTFDAYLGELGRTGPEFLDEGLRVRPDTTSLERLHRRLVGRTWEMSLDLLDAQGLGAARGLMRLMSCFASTPFPVDLIEPATIDGSRLLAGPVSLDELGSGLEALVDVHQLNLAESGSLTAVPEGFPDPPLPCVAGHRLVLETTAVRVRSFARAERGAVWRAAAQVLEAAAKPVPEEPANRNWWQLMTPHVHAALTGVPDDDVRTVARLLSVGLRCFTYLAFSGRYPEAGKLATVLSERSGLLDPDHPVRLAVRHRQVLLDDTLTAQEERVAYQDILDRQRAVLGPDHPDVLITDHNWAATLLAEPDLERAEVELRRVAEHRTKILGATNVYTLLSRGEWATALAHLGREDEAETALRVIVEDCRRDLGPVHHSTIHYRTELAGRMFARGHEEDGDAEYDSVIAIYGTDNMTSGRDLSLSARHQLAHALDRVKRFPEAEAEYRAVLEIIAAHDGAATHEFRHLSLALGINLRSQGRPGDSVGHLEELIAACADLHATDPFLLKSRHQYSDSLDSAGRVVEAEAVLSEVVALRGDSLDSAALSDRHCRAHLLQKLGRPDEAEVELRIVSSSLEQLIGAEAEAARRVTWCHAKSLLNLDRLDEALGRLEGCLEAELAALGRESRDVLVTQLYIAETRLKLGLTGAADARAELDALLPRLVAYDGPDGRLVLAAKKTLASLL